MPSQHKSSGKKKKGGEADAVKSIKTATQTRSGRVTRVVKSNLTTEDETTPKSRRNKTTTVIAPPTFDDGAKDTPAVPPSSKPKEPASTTSKGKNTS